MLTTIFIIILVFALYHFIYESMIAPAFRQELRFKLFALRDEVRLLRITHDKNELPDNVFNMLEETINTIINRLPFITLSVVVQSNSKVDNYLQKKIDARKVALEDCEVARAKEIHKEAIILVTKGFLINSGGWMLILFPVFIVVLFLALVSASLNRLKIHIAKTIYSVALLSDSKFSRFQQPAI